MYVLNRMSSSGQLGVLFQSVESDSGDSKLFSNRSSCSITFLGISTTVLDFRNSTDFATVHLYWSPSHATTRAGDRHRPVLECTSTLSPSAWESLMNPPIRCIKSLVIAAFPSLQSTEKYSTSLKILATSPAAQLTTRVTLLASRNSASTATPASPMNSPSWTLLAI